MLVNFVVLGVSCHTPFYVFSRNSTPHGIEFREGKWLMDAIEAPAGIKQSLTSMGREDFGNYLKKDLFYLAEQHVLLFHSHFPLNPEEKCLRIDKLEQGSTTS